MTQPAHFRFPVFPLSRVLFPGAMLPLRIFEPRYLRMVADCLKNERGFIICQISSGREAGQAASFHSIGTLAKIIDWNDGAGMLQITCEGDRRLQVLNSTIEEDQLITSEAVYLEREPVTGIALQHQPLVQMITDLFTQHEVEVDPHLLTDASWVSFRLAESLPLPPARKQWLLELTNPTLRLGALAEDIAALRTADKLGGNADPPPQEKH